MPLPRARPLRPPQTPMAPVSRLASTRKPPQTTTNLPAPPSPTMAAKSSPRASLTHMPAITPTPKRADTASVSMPRATARPPARSTTRARLPATLSPRPQPPIMRMHMPMRAASTRKSRPTLVRRRRPSPTAASWLAMPVPFRGRMTRTHVARHMPTASTRAPITTPTRRPPPRSPTPATA